MCVCVLLAVFPFCLHMSHLKTLFFYSATYKCVYNWLSCVLGPNYSAVTSSH